MRNIPDIVGQYSEGDSFIHHLDPRTKIISLLILSGVIFFLNSWQEYAALAGICALLLLLGKVPVRRWFSTVRPLAWFLGLILVMHLGSAGGWRVGAAVVARFILLLSLAALLTSTTPIFSLAMGLQKILGSSIAFMVTMAIRFIPLALLENQKIMEAQQVRGVRYSPKNIPLLAYALLVNIMKKADELARGIEARGFHLGPHRTSLYQLKFTVRDAVALAAVVAFSASIAGNLWSLP
ncbi:MAG: energy-coupling factor transporter transmembrane component T [bacterium]|nr:energy-coupling factor transporter transmembrane component T [bacterium]MDD5354214.1 energy-coupling factor transporter transmembrane component T [bacterium]MDD5756253.1 energy-coupling factor transporter transmembrane component T [bacterium]